MEEILASIRRIISEDDAPAEAAAAVQAEPETSPAMMDETPSVQEPAASEEDVLELTDRYEAPAAETIGDLEVSTPEAEPEPFPTTFEAPEPAHEPAPAAAPAPVAAAYDDGLVGAGAAASASAAFAGLSAALRKPEPVEAFSGSGPTIDELARSLLKPMLKDWLDANLPGIVDAAVRKEVERISRAAG